MTKLFELIAGTITGGFLAWIAYSFIEIGFTNTAQTWNFIKIILEVTA